MATAVATAAGFSPATVGREMQGRNARTASPVRAGVALVIGIPFTAVGAALALFGAGVVGHGRLGAGAPPWLAVVFGGVFAWAGLSFVVHGALELRRRRRVRLLQRRHPEQPCWSDHPWDPRGAHDQTPAEALRAAYFALFMVVFLTPFHWVGFFAPDRVVVFGLFALVFDLAAAAVLWRAIYLLIRMMKYGRGALVFARFPFRPGERVELYVAAPRGVRAPGDVTATLRCVQERFEVRGTGKNRSMVTVCYELLAAPVGVTAVDDGAGGTALRLAAEVPRGAPPTALAQRPPRYWELELSAATPGVDYGATYLVPVY